MSDFKLDIEVKITARPLTPKVGLISREPFERNSYLVIERATRFLYNVAKSDIATLATNALKVPNKSWGLATATPPEAETRPATSILAASFVLNGKVHPHGTSTAISFDWGTTVACGSNNAADSGTPSTLNAWTDFTYTKASGATANTQYYFRVKSVQGSITIYGALLTFKTAAS